MFDELNQFIASLQGAVDPLPLPLQIIAVFAIGMIPFLEGDVSAGIGVAAGIPLVPVIIAAAAGTILVTIGAVALGSRRTRTREDKIVSRAQRFGIPLAMIIGGFLVSVPLNALVMSAARLDRTTILISGAVTAVINATFVGLVAAGVLVFIS